MHPPVSSTEYGLFESTAFTGSNSTPPSAYTLMTAPSFTGSMAAVYGLAVIDAAKTGTGTLGTQYGVYVGSLAAATTNYAFYSAQSSNPSWFGGKVGIGSNSTNALPGQTLLVSDYQNVASFQGVQASGGLRISGASASGAGSYSLLGFGAGNQTSNLAQIGAYMDVTGSRLVFGTSSLYTSGITNTAMTIDPSGKVGIGSASPASALDVVSSGSLSVQTFAARANPGGTGGGNFNSIVFDNLYGPGNFKNQFSLRSQGVEKWSLGNDINGAGLQNFYLWDGVAAKARLFVDGSGNVGIGSTTPDQALTVVGNVHVSGTGNGITFPDGTTMTTAGPYVVNGNSAATSVTIQTANYPAITVDNNQNVTIGMGTGAGTRSLTVDGDIKLPIGGNGIHFSDNSFQTKAFTGDASTLKTRTWESPGAIGSSTAASVVYTTTLGLVASTTTCNGSNNGDVWFDAANVMWACLSGNAVVVSRPKPSVHLMFVTSQLFYPAATTGWSSGGTGTFNGIAGGDQMCRQAAYMAGLSWWSTATAVLSDPTTPASQHVTVSYDVYDTNGTFVATAGTFWGTSHTGPVKTERGGSPGANHAVWTGTNSSGAYSGSTCSAWTTNSSGSGTQGDYTTLINWLDNGTVSCSSSSNYGHLYCISQ